ncbi:MAG: threonyl-tRNA synthetase editing domain-containing protein [Bacteroidota bacterium]
MKVLLIYCKTFAYNPTSKTLDMAEINEASASFDDVQTAFVQVEENDIERETEVSKKLLKNIKWVCGKNNTKKVVLHSFAHLSNSKGDPETTLKIFNSVEERLKNVGYEVAQTPFGYFLDLQVDAPGFSLARVFKSF